MATKIDDSFDPFAVFRETQLTYSDTSQAATRSSGDGSGHFDLSSALTGAGVKFGISAAVFGVLGFLQTQAAKVAVRYFIQYATETNATNADTVPEVCFDLVLYSYASAMLQANEKANTRNTTAVLKGSWDALTGNKAKKAESGVENWMHCVAFVKLEPFKSVPAKISRNVIAFLTACYIPCHVISHSRYLDLLKEFTRERHTQYESLAPPRSHLLAPRSVAQLTTPASFEDVSKYYAQRYHNYDFINDAKLFKSFKKHIDTMPIGEDSFY
jgi:hypothetical protein